MSEARRVAEELQQWAKRMGFDPGTKEYTSVEAFEKICRGKSIKMWQDVMKHVRPKEEILHIQKNLLLQRLKLGKPLEKDPIPGHLSQQVLLASKLDEKEKERKALLESIQKRESSIKIKEKALRKSGKGHKAIELQNQIDEFRKKQLLFKIKFEESRSRLNWSREVTGLASNICPPAPKAKPPSANGSAGAVLYKSVDAIQDFLSKSRGAELEVCESSYNKEVYLQHLWQQIGLNFSGWGAQQIWDAINEEHLAKLMEEILMLCGDESETGRPTQSQPSCSGNAASLLPAKYMTAVLEFLNLKTKAQIKEAALKRMQEDVAIQAAKLSTSLLNKSCMNVPDIIKTWIEAQSTKAELAGKLQGIKAELSRLKETMPCRTSASSRLKCVNEELARLDFQVNNDKKLVEENLARMKMIACQLRSAQAKALAQRDIFNGQVPSFFHMSKLHPYDSDANSPGRAPFSSTMIGNVTADSNGSFDTTFGSIPDKFSGQSNISEVLTVLKESLSKEAKLFIKVHLEMVPFVIRNGRRESICNLMVHGPLMTSRTSNMAQRNFLQMVQGTPFTSAPQILLKQLYSHSHVRALLKYKAMNGIPSSPALQTSANLGALRNSAPKQESSLNEKIEVVDASLSSIKLLLSKSKDNFEIWLERPIQNAVPPDMKVKDLTFQEWCKRYDAQQ